MSKKFLNTVVLTSCLLGATQVWAADTPPSLEGATLVTAQQAKALIAGGAIPVDVRTKLEYAEGHIPGARNVPYKEASAKEPGYDATQDNFELTDKIPDKASKLVIYCNGAECWKSYKASKFAVKAGYAQVNWLRGGLPEWKQAGLPTE